MTNIKKGTKVRGIAKDGVEVIGVSANHVSAFQSCVLIRQANGRMTPVARHRVEVL